ncbi:hypothetical protein AMC99_02059 [Altererythrobacter epoxidivorans]|uniref:DUF7847 domain-containing protein n=2 Tax=Altererythrobacter epoxidivorans TaxID=361183 RepID=A0A0M4MUU8_9SPHN|nr:hypothetical protein AMC99_02059 [Altererythrobacter epoxidivorans]
MRETRGISMKLDMGRAWNSATAMLAANKSMIAVVAGVFFFLPYLALSLLLPQTMAAAQPGDDPEQILAALTAMYSTYWWAFLLVSVAQIIGMLAILVLMSDRSRPTVGEALSRGAKGFLPYFLSQMLAIFGLMVVLGIPIGIASAAGAPAIVALLALIAAVIGVYVMVKFSLAAPVVAAEGLMNPVAILRRSWALTKGNSLRIFGFFLLLFIAIMVVTAVVTMVLGVLFAAIGGQVELIGNGVVSSLVNAVFLLIFYAALTAVHRQLGGPTTSEVSETFE